MKILGIDYGRKKIGIAVSESALAEPWMVIKINTFEEALDRTQQIIEEYQPDKIVVGVSESEMGEESKLFAEKLGAVTYDETLSSYDAQMMSIQAGTKRSKRKNMEDAYAASIMLQNYLDTSI